jgi:hypothetical protein
MGLPLELRRKIWQFTVESIVEDPVVNRCIDCLIEPRNIGLTLVKSPLTAVKLVNKQVHAEIEDAVKTRYCAGQYLKFARCHLHCLELAERCSPVAKKGQCEAFQRDVVRAAFAGLPGIDEAFLQAAGRILPAFLKGVGAVKEGK